MTTIHSTMRIGALLLVTSVLSACLGSGSGGGAGSGGGGGGAGGGGAGGGDAFAAYDDAYADATANVLANAPTSDMPVSGSANFSGEAKLTQFMNGDGTLAADAVLADVALAVQFGAGSTGRISGSADNIRRSLDGKVETYDVRLTSDYAGNTLKLPSSIATVENTINVPGRGPITTRTGSYQVNMAAPVTTADIPDLETDGDLLLTLGGAFTGQGAQGSIGSASAQILDDKVRVAGGSGTHYTKRD